MTHCNEGGIAPCTCTVRSLCKRMVSIISGCSPVTTELYKWPDLCLLILLPAVHSWTAALSEAIRMSDFNRSSDHNAMKDIGKAMEGKVQAAVGKAVGNTTEHAKGRVAETPVMVHAAFGRSEWQA